MIASAKVGPKQTTRLYFAGEELERVGGAWELPFDVGTRKEHGVWRVSVGRDPFTDETGPVAIVRRMAIYTDATNRDPSLALAIATSEARLAALEEADYLLRWAGSPRFILTLAIVHVARRLLTWWAALCALLAAVPLRVGQWVITGLTGVRRPCWLTRAVRLVVRKVAIGVWCRWQDVRGLITGRLPR